jgi:Tripartite tricarboxylate transporter family receptor
LLIETIVWNIDHAKRTEIMLSMTRFLFMAAVTVGPWIFGERAAAQSFPNRSIALYVSFAPGSPQDLIMRAIAEAAAKDLGQPVVVDNKPGAAATLAAANLLAAKPDGIKKAQDVQKHDWMDLVSARRESLVLTRRVIGYAPCALPVCRAPR